MGRGRHSERRPLLFSVQFNLKLSIAGGATHLTVLAYPNCPSAGSTPCETVKSDAPASASRGLVQVCITIPISIRCWGLGPGLHTCSASTPPTELHSQSISNLILKSMCLRPEAAPLHSWVGAGRSRINHPLSWGN